MAQLKSTVVQGALTVTGNVVANKLIKLGGTSDEILMADGTTSSKSEILSKINAAVTMKGTLGTDGTIDSLPAASASNLGYGYKVITAGTYNGVAAKIGDMFICYKNGSSYAWMHIPSGDDIEDTWRPISLEGTQILANGNTTNALNFKAGTNIGISNSDGTLTFTATDTGATAITTSGSGNAVTGGSYDASSRTITLTKGNTFVDLSSAQTITGDKTFTGNVVTSNNKFEIKANSNTDDSWIKLTNATDAGYYAFGIRRPYDTYGLQLKIHPASGSDTYYDIWHAGNDGTGSGLDADLLDGKHASAFALTSNIPTVNDATITLTAGNGLTGGESFTTNQSSAETITFALATYGTAGTYGPTDDATLSHSGTFTVPKVVTDDYGRVTAANITYTLPTDNDTKNTAGSTNSDDKLFLIGATSQAVNPQTYSDSEVYTTNGTLTTKKVQVGGGTTTLQYNSTEGCLEFVFA